MTRLLKSRLTNAVTDHMHPAAENGATKVATKELFAGTMDDDSTSSTNLQVAIGKEWALENLPFLDDLATTLKYVVTKIAPITDNGKQTIQIRQHHLIDSQRLHRIPHDAKVTWSVGDWIVNEIDDSSIDMLSAADRGVQLKATFKNIHCMAQQVEAKAEALGFHVGVDMTASGIINEIVLVANLSIDESGKLELSVDRGNTDIKLFGVAVLPSGRGKFGKRLESYVAAALVAPIEEAIVLGLNGPAIGNLFEMYLVDRVKDFMTADKLNDMLGKKLHNDFQVGNGILSNTIAARSLFYADNAAQLAFFLSWTVKGDDDGRSGSMSSTPAAALHGNQVIPPITLKPNKAIAIELKATATEEFLGAVWNVEPDVSNPSVEVPGWIDEELESLAKDIPGLKKKYEDAAFHVKLTIDPPSIVSKANTNTISAVLLAHFVLEVHASQGIIVHELLRGNVTGTAIVVGPTYDNVERKFAMKFTDAQIADIVIEHFVNEKMSKWVTTVLDKIVVHEEPVTLETLGFAKWFEKGVDLIPGAEKKLDDFGKNITEHLHDTVKGQIDYALQLANEEVDTEVFSTYHAGTIPLDILGQKTKQELALDDLTVSTDGTSIRIDAGLTILKSDGK